MRTTPQIEEAQAAYKAATKLADELRKQLKEAELEQGKAYSAIKAAMIDRDATLPQCDRVITSRWLSKASRDKVVIVKKNPAGTIFVRAIGGEDKYKEKYKPDQSGVYRLSKKHEGSNWLENIPEQFKD